MENTKKAVKIFNEQGVANVFHAGDIISPFVVSKVLSELKCKLFAVFGNNDGEKFGLKNQLAKMGATIEENQLSVSIDGRRIVLFHTLNGDIHDAIMKFGSFDIVIFGHTHNPVIEDIDGTLGVNPGEACGYLTGKATIAIIDLEKMEAELIIL